MMVGGGVGGCGWWRLVVEVMVVEVVEVCGGGAGWWRWWSLVEVVGGVWC